MQDRVLTLSNVLSLSRILLVAPLAFCLLADVPDKRSWVALIISLAVLTDFLDGYVARKRHEVSEFGKIIDPVADKIAVGATGGLMVWTGDLPFWYLAVVVGRDLLLLLGGIYIRNRKNITVQSNWPGKIAVNAIALVLLLSILRIEMLEEFRQVMIWGSIVLMAVSFASYLRRLFLGQGMGKKVVS